MSPQQLLQILEINRESISRNTYSAISELRELQQDFGHRGNDTCELSFALSYSMIEMLFHANYTKAIELSQSALAKFPKIKPAYYTAYHYRVIGRCQIFIGKHNEAQQNLEKAFQILDKLEIASAEEVQLLGDTLHDLAMLNSMRKGDPEQSIRYLEKAITILQHDSFTVRKAVCQMGIGNVKYEEGKSEEALVHYHQSADIFEAHSALKNLACAFSNIGLCHLALKQYEQAEKYLKRALNLHEKAGSPDDQANVYYNLAQLRDAQNKWQDAFNYLLRCRDFAESSGNKHIHMQTLKYLEQIATKLNDAKGAETFREEYALVQ